MKEKLISFGDAVAFFDQLRKEGKKIVQCHGTFDLIHPGHIVHFEEAKELGDYLVVTITSDEFVNKGPGRPYFSDQLRVKSLAALESVDYIVVIPFAAAVEAIDCVKPDFYCKGKEYENPNNDVTGNIYDDVSTVEKHGGQIHYVGSVVYSSTKLINNHFDALPDTVKSFCRNLNETICETEFRRTVESFSDIRVLIVGDIIFDKYTFVNVQGLTSKNQTLSSRFLNEDCYAGGSLAIYRHLSSFVNHVDLLALLGDEQWAHHQLDEIVPRERNLCHVDADYTTVVKHRYVEKSIRSKELSKLLSVNYIDEQFPGSQIVDSISCKLKNIIRNYDIVLVADFGHGLLQKEIREVIQELSPFMTLNCQTNSNNHGFNIIDRQYDRADALTLDQQEIMLSCGERNPDFEKALCELKNQFGSSYAWLTRGANETIGLGPDNSSIHAPVLEQQVLDTVGAGDALFSIVSLAAYLGLSIELATFLGQLAGAQAVNIVGNAESIRKDYLLKAGQALMSF